MDPRKLFMTRKHYDLFIYFIRTTVPLRRLADLFGWLIDLRKLSGTAQADRWWQLSQHNKESHNSNKHTAQLVHTVGAWSVGEHLSQKNDLKACPAHKSIRDENNFKNSNFNSL